MYRLKWSLWRWAALLTIVSFPSVYNSELLPLFPGAQGLKFRLSSAPPLRSHLLLLTSYYWKWSNRTNSIDPPWERGGNAASGPTLDLLNQNSRQIVCTFQLISPGYHMTYVLPHHPAPRCSSASLVWNSSGNHTIPISHNTPTSLPLRAKHFGNSTASPKVPGHPSSPELGKPNTPGLWGLIAWGEKKSCLVFVMSLQ